MRVRPDLTIPLDGCARTTDGMFRARVLGGASGAGATS